MWNEHEPHSGRGPTGAAWGNGNNMSDMNKKLQGKLLIWNLNKCCGVIAVRQPNGKIDRFFLHESQVDVQIPENLHAGCVVRFDIDSTRPPTRPNEFWRAIHAEVFDENGDPSTKAAANALSGNGGVA